ncbi:hypothetical protein Hte_002523 [Hypoxylon texense]
MAPTGVAEPLLVGADPPPADDVTAAVKDAAAESLVAKGKLVLSLSDVPNGETETQLASIVGDAVLVLEIKLNGVANNSNVRVRIWESQSHAVRVVSLVFTEQNQHSCLS